MINNLFTSILNKHLYITPLTPLCKAVAANHPILNSKFPLVARNNISKFNMTVDSLQLKSPNGNKKEKYNVIDDDTS